VRQFDPMCWKGVIEAANIRMERFPDNGAFGGWPAQ